MLEEFIGYLKEQVGQPYLWGGQHTKLTPENYITVITKKETTKDGKPRGTYPDGETYADAAIAFCKAKFDDGATVLYAYDCSGLGMYFLQNVKHIYDRDVNANTLMGRCSGLTAMSNPAKGWWVFRQDSNGKATHIGYMVDDETVVEAKGRRYGVVETIFRAKDWTIWGIPDVFYDEIVNPEPQPVPPEPPVADMVVKVIGKSVRVRKSDTALSRTLYIAHNRAWYREHGFGKKGDQFPFIDVSPNGWYHIEYLDGEAYISSKERLTQLVEEET